uniref:Transcription initiation factor IIF subunit alpha n=1 Tax=Salix viminalis TaxID=40686 RepID=A0A6N2K0N7_SALVM
MSIDLHLQPSCSGCGSTTDLYGSNCKHMTLCLTCGKTMAENRGNMLMWRSLCEEYNVRASTISEKNYFIGRFVTGLPSFSKKKSAENKWSLLKEGIHGRQITDTLREKFKNKPWLLEDETGQFQYQGHLEGSQSATYYLLMMSGKEYNFNKVAHYKQLTLEEAEEKMKNRRKTADGYERWMMKAAHNGAAAFGEVEKPDDKDGVSAGGRGGRKKAGGDDDDEGNVSEKGEEDEEEEAGRKSRLGLNKGGGDDWEHEEIFTDDDEAVAIDPEEREDLAPEVPAPPEIKQDEENEDEENEEGGLSKSGKELKKLLGKANGLNESDAEDDDDNDDMDDDISPELAPKQKDAVPKEEPADNSPAKTMPPGSAKGTPSTSKSAAKGKRKLNADDAKTSNAGVKPTVKEESSPATKGTATPKVLPSSSKTGSTGPVTEEEIRAVLLQNGPVTTQDLVARFKSRLRTPEDKKAFADILRRISKIQKTSGSNFVVLRDK